MSVWKSAALALVLGKQVNNVTSNSRVLFLSNPLLSEVQFPTPSLKATVPLVVLSSVLGFIITASKYSKWLWLKKCSSEDVLFFAPTVRHQQLLLSQDSLVQKENPPYHKEGAQGSACLCFPGMCVEVSTSPILSPFIRVLEIKLESFRLLGNTLPPGPSPWPPALSGSSLFLPVLLFFSWLLSSGQHEGMKWGSMLFFGSIPSSLKVQVRFWLCQGFPLVPVTKKGHCLSIIRLPDIHRPCRRLFAVYELEEVFIIPFHMT